ncbi:MAG: hypothetical protein ABI273_15000 [Lacunisphaera sp.]
MTTLSRFPVIAATAFAVAMLGSLAPTNALARQHNGRFSGKRNGTLATQVTRSPDHVEKTSTYTSPTGKVSTRESSRTTDPTTGNITGSSHTTLADGKTASTTMTSDKTATGRTTTEEHTGFNGKTSTEDSTLTKTADGFTRDITKTGPNGGKVEKDITVTKQNGTVDRTVTTTKTPPPTP